MKRSMKAEDQFENRLKRQTLTPLPRELRNEILDAALQARRSSRGNEALTSYAGDGRFGLSLVSAVAARLFSQLLWPSGKAWAALAAVWIVIIGFILASGDSDQHRVVSRSEQSSPLVQELLREQNRLFAELSGGPNQGEAVTKRRGNRGPRSRCDVVWREA